MVQHQRSRHQRKGESRAHSMAHKYDGHKMAMVVNHNHYTRQHGYESTKRDTEKKP